MGKTNMEKYAQNLQKNPQKPWIFLSLKIEENQQQKYSKVVYIDPVHYRVGTYLTVSSHMKSIDEDGSLFSEDVDDDDSEGDRDEDVENYHLKRLVKRVDMKAL